MATRIGLLNTMVFTHLPSNICLILVPFMPTLPAAIAVLFARFAISQMDVPARQAYVVSVVEPGEQTAATAYTNTARYVVRPFGPALAGALMASVGLAAPFVVAGALKIRLRRRAADHVPTNAGTTRHSSACMMTGATATTDRPFSSRITRTPCVARPGLAHLGRAGPG